MLSERKVFVFINVPWWYNWWFNIFCLSGCLMELAVSFFDFPQLFYDAAYWKQFPTSKQTILSPLFAPSRLLYVCCLHLLGFPLSWPLTLSLVFSLAASLCFGQLTAPSALTPLKDLTSSTLTNHILKAYIHSGDERLSHWFFSRTWTFVCDAEIWFKILLHKPGFIYSTQQSGRCQSGELKRIPDRRAKLTASEKVNHQKLNFSPFKPAQTS